MSAEIKQQIVTQIEDKSSQETEKLLFSLFPQTASKVHQEKRYVVNENETRYQLNLSNEASENLARLKEMLSHKFPQASDAQIISYALEELATRLFPKLKDDSQDTDLEPKSVVQKGGSELKNVRSLDSKSTSAAEVKRLPSKAAVRRAVFINGQSRCGYIDPVTQHSCGSSYQVQVDHIVPKALGGGDEAKNLRLLCRQHNLLMAEKVFGSALIEKYRKRLD